MPWQSNGGGDKPNPWGSGPRSGGGGSGRGPQPPNLDEFIRKGQDSLRSLVPGGGKGVMLFLLALFVIWIAMGTYRVQTNEQAVILRFGKYSESAGPGLHWHLPYPIETVEIRGVTDENMVEIGRRTQVSRRGGSQVVSARDESLMLTGDRNIVDIKFNVVWRIGDLGLFLFNLKDPTQTIKAVAESAMREVVGQNAIEPIITSARERIQQNTLELMQQTLDEYQSGITILRVQIRESDPPDEVKDAFLDVQRASADSERVQNEAEAYSRDVVPKARGEADKILQAAEAYRASVVARAEGDAARFTAVYNEYRQAKDVTKKRLYLETMEQILEGMDKIILDGEAGSGVVPYLPLDQLRKGKSASQGGQNNE